jgi:hypothetical protein
VEAVERQESKQGDPDQNGQIDLLNCYQKPEKITSQAPNLNGRSLILIGIPDGLGISGGQFEAKRAV